jgi:SpoIVB peptidase S55
MAGRRFLCLLFLFAVALSARAQDTPAIFPLDQVEPGLKGIGRTVFEGNEIQDFQVEIVGVLKNAIGPKHDVILARLSGGPLEKTGVIAGMSGSPVYVDGKLVGAVALSFPFAKDAYAGITPIGEMLDVVPNSAQPQKARRTTGLEMRILPAAQSDVEGGRLLPDPRIAESGVNALVSAPAEASGLSSMRLPLRFGGFSSEIMQSYSPLFQRLGFEPMQGGVMSGSPPKEKPGAAGGAPSLEPGSMISLLLVQGDLNLNVDCTVTLRRGNDLYACGHRFLMAGPVEFPFAPSSVMAVVPSLASSFKLDSPGSPVGTIRQDRFGAIYGVVGEKAGTIPVHIHLSSTLNRQEDYNFQMVQEGTLTPLLLNVAVVSSISSTERITGPSTLNIQGSIRLSSGDSINLEDIVSADLNSAAIAGLSASTPLTYLLRSGFPDLKVEDIDLSISASDENQTASIEQAWSTKSEVDPGDNIEVTAVLRTPWGENVVEKIPVEIPSSVRDKMLSLVVGSGATINAFENRLSPLGSTPRDLHQLVRALNRMRRNNRLYVLLMAPQTSFEMQGDEYPSPPPSLVQTFLSDPSVSSSVVYRGTSVVGDFETKALPYSIRGQKTLLLKVSSVGQ